MVAFGKVSLNSIYHEDAQYSLQISGTVTEADVGKALAIDTSAPNTLKLADDNDVILGRLAAFEDRVAQGLKMCTLSAEGAYAFPVNPDATASGPDETPAVGDYICGAKNNAGALGFVQKIANGAQQKWLVTELIMNGSTLTHVVALKV